MSVGPHRGRVFPQKPHERVCQCSLLTTQFHEGVTCVIQRNSVLADQVHEFTVLPGEFLNNTLQAGHAIDRALCLALVQLVEEREVLLAAYLYPPQSRPRSSRCLAMFSVTLYFWPTLNVK